MGIREGATGLPRLRLNALLMAGVFFSFVSPGHAQEGPGASINGPAAGIRNTSTESSQMISDEARAESREDADVGADTALPSEDGVNARSPGLQLESQEGQSGEDPFAEAAAPVKSPEQVESEIRNRSYTAALTGLMPLKPDEIRTLLETYDKTQQSVEVPIYPYPDPQVVVQTVSLDPGVKPPEIKVATGHVSTVSILDLTGAPWPIQDISWAGNFEIVQPEAGGSVMRITPMSEFAYGNMSVRLVGLTTPVTFMIKTHRDVVQYRFDAKIAMQGPGAKPPVIEGATAQMAAAGNSTLSSILDGVPPDGARRLEVDGTDGRTTAFRMEKNIYVRTPLTLLSPAWSGSVSSGDGMNVYQLGNAPVLLLSDNGQILKARLSEKDQIQ